MPARPHFSRSGLAGIVSLLFVPCVVAQEVVYISEFMASNTRSRKPGGQPMYDEERSYEDWIELLNAGTEPVNLEGWSLTDNAQNLRKWTFPAVVLPPGERLIVWASDKNRKDPATGLHTNFKLGAEGEYLALVRRDGSTVAHEFTPQFPPQKTDVSYGLSEPAEGAPAMPGVNAFFTTPTPGAANGEGSQTIPPLVLDVPENLPAPTPDVPLSLPITARVVTTNHPVATVTLGWRKMFETETTVPMRDDGQEGDAAAGDGIYTGLISGVTLGPGQMLRWRVTATDAEGAIGKAPPNHIPNNAGANASAIYYGTVAQDPSLADSRLPVLHWFASSATAGDSDSVARIAISYLGEFYDNVGVSLHGQSTRAFPKKSYNLAFPGDRRLFWKDGVERAADLKLLSNYADKTKSRNTLAWELNREAGVAALQAWPVRVQRNGQFYALADAVEDADDRYLTRAGLNPQGALYKLYATLSSGLPAGESGQEKKTRKWENSADLNALATGLNRSGEALLQFGFDNVDLPASITMLAANSMTSNTDLGHKNYFLYRDTGITNEWRLLPWDQDLTFGHNWTSDFNYFNDQLYTTNAVPAASAPGGGNSMFAFCYRGKGAANGGAAIADMYHRRLRTLRDKFLAQTGTEDWHYRRLNEMLALLDPPGVTSSDAALDTAKWTAASWRLSGQPGNNSPFRLNNMAQEISRVLETYVTGRRTYLYTGSIANTTLPAPQPATPALQFGDVEANPAPPDSTGEYFTVVNPTTLATDISGWTIGGAVDFVFPPGTVIPSQTRATANDPSRNILYVAKSAPAFRARTVNPSGGQKRFVVSGYGGQLSARGETLELRTDTGALIATKTWEPSPTDAQQWLRISELHYAPPAPTAAELAALPGAIASDFEFIELLNTGSTVLDLTGAQFTEGITFTFPEATTLAPGARLVLAASPAALALRAPDLTALGGWSGRLDNNGERLQLIDATGETVLDFRYDGDWFPEAEAQGRSLVITDPVATPWNEWDAQARWSVGDTTGGTPGRAEGQPPDPGTTYESWLPAHFSEAERADPAVSGPEADPDLDGFSNLLEYALGQNPRSGAHGVLPHFVLVTEDGATYPALTFRRVKGATDLTWEVLTSGSLAQDAWTARPTTPFGPATDHGDGTETVTLRLTEPLTSGDTPRFARLRVSRP